MSRWYTGGNGGAKKGKDKKDIRDVRSRVTGLE
jgi:hypothetical protein